MIRTLAICAALMLVSAVAYAAIPTLAVSWSYDFQARTAGQEWADGVDWGQGNDAGLEKVVVDPLNSGNLCGQILPHTATQNHYYYVYMNQGVLPGLGMDNYDLQVMQFKVQMHTGSNWNNWDRPGIVNWTMGAASGSGDFAYGSTIGTGFSIGSELGVGKAQGSMGYGPAILSGVDPWPGNFYHTSDDGIISNYGTGEWHTMTMVMNRVSGVFEWYRDGVMFASKTLVKPSAPPPAATPALSEWLWGSDWTIDGKARCMDWLEFGVWGRWNETGHQILYDDILVGGANIVPEPSSLLAFATFGIGAFGLIRRRRA